MLRLIVALTMNVGIVGLGSWVIRPTWGLVAEVDYLAGVIGLLGVFLVFSLWPPKERA